MTDSILDITRPITRRFNPSNEPAFDFLRLAARRGDGLDIAMHFFSRPDERTADEDLLQAALAQFDSEEPPQNLNELRERVDGLGDVLADRLNTALTANGATRLTTARLQPALIEALLDPDSDPIATCPPPDTTPIPLDLDQVGAPFLLDQSGLIDRPGEEFTGLDSMLRAQAGFALTRLARARVENNEQLIGLLDELEQAAVRIVCRMGRSDQPRADVACRLTQMLEALARDKATRNADERMEAAALTVVGDFLAASPGRRIQFPQPWLTRINDFPESDDDGTFIEDPIPVTQTKTYELAVLLNKVKCVVETSPKWGSDEFRIGYDARADGSSIATGKYADDFDEAADGNTKIPNLEFFNIKVPSQKGKTRTFKLLLQPYESDSITFEDLKPFLKVFSKIIDVLAEIAAAALRAKITRAIQKASAQGRTVDPKLLGELRKAATATVDKAIVKEAVKLMAEKSAIGFLNFFNGPDPFTIVTVTGSVTSNGPTQPPTWRYTVSGGSVPDNKKRQGKVVARTKVEEVRKFPIHEANVPKEKRGEYELTMSVVVRESKAI